MIGFDGQRDEAAEDGRDADHGVGDAQPFSGFERLDPQEDVQALVVEMWEGVGGVDGQRGEDGEDFAFEVFVEEGVLGGGKGFGSAEDEAVAGQFGADFGLPGFVLVGDEVVAAPGDFDELGEGGHAVRRGVLGLEVVVELGLEAGDADLEEFVEVGGGDGQEAEAFKEGVGGVAGFFEDALVEFKPAQLAVDEVLGVERWSGGGVLRGEDGSV